MLTRRSQSGFALISTSLLALIGVGAVGGDVLAKAAEGQAIAVARAGVDRADAAFLIQVSASIGDGTPAELLAPLRRREAALRQASLPRRRFFVDRYVTIALEGRARAI